MRNLYNEKNLNIPIVNGILGSMIFHKETLRRYMRPPVKEGEELIGGTIEDRRRADERLARAHLPSDAAEVGTRITTAAGKIFTVAAIFDLDQLPSEAFVSPGRGLPLKRDLPKPPTKR